MAMPVVEAIDSKNEPDAPVRSSLQLGNGLDGAHTLRRVPLKSPGYLDANRL